MNMADPQDLGRRPDLGLADPPELLRAGVGFGAVTVAAPLSPRRDHERHVDALRSVASQGAPEAQRLVVRVRR